MKFKALTLAVALATALAASAGAQAGALTENFDGGVPAGWTVKNRSNPLGVSSWFVGETSNFNAQSGAADSYLAADYNSGAGDATLSTWLIMPTSTYNDGDTLSFFTRTTFASNFADNLEIRYSSVGGTDVGATANSVGTFTNLLLSINPNQNVGGYPEAWTQYSVTLTGLGGTSTGAFAFRYFVGDGGPDGNNSNYIGLDTVSVSEVEGGGDSGEVPEPATLLLAAAGLGVLALRRRAA